LQIRCIKQRTDTVNLKYLPLLGQAVLVVFDLSQELGSPLLAFRPGEKEQSVAGAELAEAKNGSICHLSAAIF
jgi:hypothetical protein